MKKKSLYIFAALASIFLAASCSSTKPTTSAQTKVVNHTPTEKSLLWKITGKNLKSPSYLFGTIHLIPSKDFFLNDATKQAFAKANTIAFEVDLKEMENPAVLMKLMHGTMLPNGMTLKDLVSESDYQLYKEKSKEFAQLAGLGSMAERMKPIFLSTMMTKDNIGTDISSYETTLMEMATNQEKKTIGLESIDFQLSIFDSIPYKDQAKMLIDGLSSNDEKNAEKMFQTMVEHYKKQDLPALTSIIKEQSVGIKNMESLLIDKRNSNWIPIIAKQSAEQATFFAVGAGHLGGEKGVIALLRKNGYTVTPFN